MNLLAETKSAISSEGHTPEDIVFIGSEYSGHSCTWDEFCRLADVEYDNGYGAQEVASDLVIIFQDGSRLRRTEYDGSEGWEHLKQFKRPAATLPIDRLVVGDGDEVGWATLEELNKSVSQRGTE